MKPALKSVSLFDSNTFKIIRQENKEEFDFPWHYHPEFELTFISNSQGMRYVGNSIESFEENDLVLLGSNLPHCWITGEQACSSSAVVVYLNSEMVNWFAREEFDNVTTLFNRSNQGVQFGREVALRTKANLFRLLDAEPFEKYIILLQILNDLAASNDFRILSQNGFAHELNYTNNERINAVYQFVRKNYQRKISLADVARHVNMSEEYFSRFFSKSLMKSFFTFLNEYRINHACRLLIQTDKQVSEICYSTGFESIPFFYRQFKKAKKCPPQTYRNQYLNAAR